MKKILAVILALLLGLSLTACGKDKADERGGFDKKILLKSVVYEED